MRRCSGRASGSISRTWATQATNRNSAKDTSMKERDTNAARPDGEPPVQWRRHSSHWGVFDAAHTGDRLKVRPFAGDPDPNRLIENLPDAIRHGVRVPEPMVRLGWLRDGPGPDTRRGSDDYVPMSWDEILDRLARE
ncbi:hypothetical protein L510_4950, partial [Bordetella bronchiseptica MBORD591]